MPKTRVRCWGLLAATLALLWAMSVYTPWAADVAPRLWLYDALFYSRFVLLGWGLAEAARLVFAPRRRALDVLPLALAAGAVALALALLSTGPGLRRRVEWSRAALDATANLASTPRHRAGHVLVDGLSRPCDLAEPWLWLGRPHGGGTGTSIALVRSVSGAPRSPDAGAYRFWPAAGPWWVAYQHAARQAGRDAQRRCTVGTPVASHREGLRFVDDGWRRLLSEGNR